MRERKHAGDRTILFGERVVAAMAERGLDDARPDGAMEEGATGHRGDECVPGGDAGVIERSQSDRHRYASGDAALAPLAGAAASNCSANTWSMRSQAKSRNSRSRRAVIRERLV